MRQHLGYYHLPYFSLFCVALLTASASAQRLEVKYHVVQSLVLDSADADYLTLDSRNRRLYGAGHSVIDIDRLRVVGSLPRPAFAIAIAPDLNRGVTRDGDIIDLHSLKVEATLPVATGDGGAFDSVTRHALLVGDTTFVVDVAAGTLLTKFYVDSHPQFAVADGRGHIYFTVLDANAILEFDARSTKITRKWNITPCSAPAGLAIDQPHKRLFASCTNGMLVVVNAETGEVISTVPVGSMADAIVFDPITKLILNPNTDGTMTVVHEDSPDTYSVVDKLSLGGARNSIVIDETTHRVFSYRRTDTGLQILVLAP